MWLLLAELLVWWQMGDPRDRRPFRAPDIPAEMTFAD